jgi:integrase
MPACLESDGSWASAAIIRLAQNTIFGKARKITPSRQANSAVRMRERVSPDEVERLIVAARQVSDGRSAERDALLIMMAYRHGLRASGIAGLRWNQIDLKAECSIHVTRRKDGSPSRCGRAGRGMACFRISPNGIKPRGSMR